MVRDTPLLNVLPVEQQNSILNKQSYEILRDREAYGRERIFDPVVTLLHVTDHDDRFAVENVGVLEKVRQR